MLRAAASLLEAGGVAAVSTRAVAAAAGVQPPVIYRLFGDKDGLLDAVAHYVLREYVRTKQRMLLALDDPVEELRRTWDLHIEFGLNRPDTYLLAYGTPRRHNETRTAAMSSVDLLRKMLARLADEGRLRMSVERATNIMYAAGIGTVLTLLRIPSSQRDPAFSDIARENVIAAVLSDDQSSSTGALQLPARAVALAEAIRATRPSSLSAAEQAVLLEWLSRVANHT